jgi:hypothetical protein
MIASNNILIRDTVSLDETYLAVELKQALQATIFTSGLRIAPHRVQQISQEFAAAFCQFLEEQPHAEVAYAYGLRLAQEGIGHGAMLALVDVLHHVCWESADPTSVQYGNPLLAGYMAGREADLLREQERTRLALDRARA